MKYLELIFDFNGVEDQKGLVARHGEMYGVDQYDLEKGKLIDNWNKEFIFFYKPDEGTIFTDYLGNNLGWLIISSKFKSMLEKLGNDGIQLLPIILINQKDNTKSHDYFVVNFSKLYEGIFDYESSMYVGPKPAPEKIAFKPARFYALREAKMEGLNLFKVKECPLPIFISEALQKEIKKQKLTGFDFKKTLAV